MALRLSLNDSDTRVIASFESLKGGKLIEALQIKMTYLMTKLQAKIVNEKLSGQVLNRRSGNLAGSITNPRAEIEGTSVIGFLNWSGGPAWYGRVHEFGGAGTYAINPLGSSGTRPHNKGEKRRFGKDVLRFIGRDGTIVYAKYVFHPPLPKRSFMETSLEEMKNEITNGLKDTIIEVMADLKRGTY